MLAKPYSSAAVRTPLNAKKNAGAIRATSGPHALPLSGGGVGESRPDRSDAEAGMLTVEDYGFGGLIETG